MSEKYEATGTVILVTDKVQVTDTFAKRSLVLGIEDGKYPQEVEIEFKQNSCELLNDIGKNDRVKVEFNLQGRKWEGPKGVKYFNTLSGWRVTVVEKSTVSNADNCGPDNDDMDIPF